MQQLLIRLDDITPDMDWEKFERLEALFMQYEIHPIIGVVPDNRDEKLHKQKPAEDFWERIRGLADAGWVVAQHGFTHVYVNRNAGLLGINPCSEFAGLSYREQYEKLKAGREILRGHGIDAKMFMAPAHTFDKKTLKALRALGFVSVTDGYDDRPYRRGGLLFFPCTLSEPRLPKRFDTLCLHSNEMQQAQFDALAEFIGRNRKVIGNADEVCACAAGGTSDVRMNRDGGATDLRMSRDGGATDLRMSRDGGATDTRMSRDGGAADVRTERDEDAGRICAACGARAYMPRGWLREHKNLLLRRIKRFAAENETVQTYFQRTDAAEPAEKRKKRLRGLPGLLFRLMFGKSY